jgi:hypothetical protein
VGRECKGQGLSEAEIARTQKTGGGDGPLGFVFIAPAEAQQPREKVGVVSHLTVSLNLAGAGHVAVPHAVTERNVAHYRADLALKRHAWLMGGARSVDGYS